MNDIVSVITYNDANVNLFTCNKIYSFVKVQMHNL